MFILVPILDYVCFQKGIIIHAVSQDFRSSFMLFSIKVNIVCSNYRDNLRLRINNCINIYFSIKNKKIIKHIPKTFFKNSSSFHF